MGLDLIPLALAELTALTVAMTTYPLHVVGSIALFTSIVLRYDTPYTFFIVLYGFIAGVLWRSQPFDFKYIAVRIVSFVVVMLGIVPMQICFAVNILFDFIWMPQTTAAQMETITRNVFFVLIFVIYTMMETVHEMVALYIMMIFLAVAIRFLQINVIVPRFVTSTNAEEQIKTNKGQ